MARINTLVGGSSGSTTAGLTSDQVLTLIRQNVGYEYIKTIKVTSNVSAIDITGLDAASFSSFRIIGSRLSLAGSTSANTYTLNVINGAANVDTSAAYEFQYIKFWSGSATGSNASGQTSWNASYGYGSAPATADFVADYVIENGPSSVFAANIRFQVGDSKTGGYWPSGGILHGIYSSSTTPTGLRIAFSQTVQAMQAAGFVDVLGIRIKS